MVSQIVKQSKEGSIFCVNLGDPPKAQERNFKFSLVNCLFVSFLCLNVGLFIFTFVHVKNLGNEITSLKQVVDILKNTLERDLVLIEEIKKFEDLNTSEDDDYEDIYDDDGDDLYDLNVKASTEKLNIFAQSSNAFTTIGESLLRVKRNIKNLNFEPIHTDNNSNLQKKNRANPQEQGNASHENGKNRHARLTSESKYKKPQLKSGGSQWESLEDVTSHPEATIVRDVEVHHRRNRHRQRHNIESLDERPHRNKLLPSIHFNGDTSKYVLGHHTNYNGDGHLRHLDQRYIDWTANDWVKNLSMDQHFTMSDGYLKIKENGLYFIYAQIYYLDEHDTNGYRVYKNTDTLLQCTTMTHSRDRVLKGNTCYTAIMDYLVDGDQISVQDLADGRYSLFEPGKSFFGVTKLGDVKTK